MKFRCQICLTDYPNRGYLVALLPPQSMEQVPLPETRPSAEHVEQRPHSILQRLRSSVRTKLAAATLALAGGAAAAQKADAATMHAAQFIAPDEETELSEFAVGIDIRDGVFVDIVNGSDATREAIDWVMIYRGLDDYGIDRAGDFGSDVPTEIMPNSDFSDGITHDHILVRGTLPELSRYRIGVDIDPLTGDPDGSADVDDFFGDAMVLVGKNGVLTGTPTTPGEVEAMYTGDVYHARFPVDAGIDDNYLMIEAHVPEPSSAALATGLAGGAAAALRRRRRQRDDT